VILGGGGDVLQYRGRRGKVRRGPFDEEKAAKTELTKGGAVGGVSGPLATSEGRGGGGVRGVLKPCSRSKWRRDVPRLG
jgi:hypothetical protein